MANVRISHNQRMATHAGHATAFDGPAVEGDALADHVVIADLQVHLLAAETDVLRLAANGAEGKEAVMRSDLGWSVHGNMRDQLAVFSQFHARADHAIRPDRTRGQDFYAG